MDTYTINSLDDMTRTFETLKEKAVQEAQRVLSEMQLKGPGWSDPIVFVDGKRVAAGASFASYIVRQIKPFGRINIVASGGPVQEAVEMAHQYALSRCGNFLNPTGFYASNFLWFVNGDPAAASAPDVSRMGLKGNAQLVNRTGYAALPEVYMPDHVIYGAYLLLKKRFGPRIALAFGYAPPDAFQAVWPADRARTAPLALPVLTIGHPTATFKQSVRTPGVNRRKRARGVQREAQLLMKRVGLEKK